MFSTSKIARSTKEKHTKSMNQQKSKQQKKQTQKYVLLELSDTEDKIALSFLGHLFIEQMLIKHMLDAQNSSRHYKFSGR